MTIKAQDILERVRNDLDDSTTPQLWSDPNLLNYLDEAQFQFARKGRPIRDSRTPEICVLSYKAGAFEVPYHESILRILSVLRQDSNGNLHKVDTTTQQNATSLVSVLRPDYGVTIDATRQLNRASDQFNVFIDYDENYLRFSSLAVTAGTLLLQVERLPINSITDCDNEVEIRREYVPALLAWICFRAWLKQDSETFDRKASDRCYDLFEAHADDARIEYTRRHSTAGTMKYGGISF